MKEKDPWLEEQRRKWDEETRAASIRRRNAILSDRYRLEAYPAFELVVAGIPEGAEDKKKAWVQRWNEAGTSVDWLEAAPAFGQKLRMIAMVTSPIWAELGKICMGDSGVDAPPFLPGSVWTWQELEAEKLLRLKLLDQKTLDEYVALHSAPHQFDEGEREIISALSTLSPEEQAQLERELKQL